MVTSFNSTPSLTPSPSVSGFKGFVPFATSESFVIPSASQSDKTHTFDGSVDILNTFKLHWFNGFVSSKISTPSNTPSPSESRLKISVPNAISSAFVKRSESQSI